MKHFHFGFKTLLFCIFFTTLTVSFSGCGKSNGKGNQPSSDIPAQGSKNNSSDSKKFEKLLTAADVEKISGYQGVKTIPFNPQIGAGGKLNFAIESDKPILSVMVEDALLFDSWKKNSNLNADAVPNLGDEAFRGIADSNMYTPNVTFIKGQQSIQLFTFFNLNNDMKPYLSHEQLIRLAKIIEGNM